MKKNKVAFISGITGMVGSHLADYIIDNSDWDIVGLIRWRSTLDNISHLLDRINSSLEREMFQLLVGSPVRLALIIVIQMQPKFIFVLKEVVLCEPLTKRLK